MNRALKIRLNAFALVIITLAAAIGFAAYSSWREVGRLKQQFSTGHLRSFEIADHLQASILGLQSDLVAYELRHDPRTLEEFQRDSAALDSWINQQKPVLNSARELALLNQIDNAFDAFRAASAKALNDTDRSEDSRLRHIEETQKTAAPIFDLGHLLADAHRATLEAAFLDSQKSISLLRWVIFGSLGLLIGSLIWLFVTVYREMIAPLQLKLVQTHAIIERQEKLASLGVLAAGVAHEIRNPLTAIKARLFSHQRRLNKGTEEFEDAVVIGAEINRLERIVKDFLEFARPSEPQLTRLTAEPILRDIRNLLAPQLEKRAISLRVEELCSDTFEADPQQLKQVLINLIQNGAESIEQRGVVTLRARSSTARINGHPQPVIILETQDTGKGIPLDVQKRLFDPFFSTKESGTGLGLSIAARIVEKHGGALEFQTQVNRGTTFGIILPTVE
ncbi:MAG: two-component system sensor histidine kinase NtrB [Limisphaerales bacterium]